MSKFTKFKNQPKRFFEDAFKKRDSKVIDKLDLVNANFKSLGVPIQFDLQIIEDGFVNAAVKIFHSNKLSHSLIELIDLERKNKKETEGFNLPKVTAIRHRLEYVFESLSPAKSSELMKLSYANQELTNALIKLSPEARLIYMQLKQKKRISGDKN